MLYWKLFENSFGIWRYIMKIAVAGIGYVGLSNAIL